MNLFLYIALFITKPLFTILNIVEYMALVILLLDLPLQLPFQLIRFYGVLGNYLLLFGQSQLQFLNRAGQHGRTMNDFEKNVSKTAAFL